MQITHACQHSGLSQEPDPVYKPNLQPILLITWNLPTFGRAYLWKSNWGPCTTDMCTLIRPIAHDTSMCHFFEWHIRGDARFWLAALREDFWYTANPRASCCCQDHMTLKNRAGFIYKEKKLCLTFELANQKWAKTGQTTSWKFLQVMQQNSHSFAILADQFV